MNYEIILYDEKGSIIFYYVKAFRSLADLLEHVVGVKERFKADSYTMEPVWFTNTVEPIYEV